MSQSRVNLFAFSVLCLHSLVACAAPENRVAEVAPPPQAEQSTAMTADRQMEGSRSDVEITREIRQQIVKDDAFSTSAKNVKIITKNGTVNLRGPVANAEERSKIASIAQSCAGVKNVRNSLVVK